MPLSNEEQKANGEGYDACQAGKSESDNPYDLQTQPKLHTSWNDGYLEAEEDADDEADDSED